MLPAGPCDGDRFPNAIKVRIAVDPQTNDGEVLDVEQGSGRPDQAPGWIRMRQGAGLARPTIYCSKSKWPEVQAACQGLTYASWVAEWTGQEHGIDGAVACQLSATISLTPSRVVGTRGSGVKSGRHRFLLPP
ncbi:hypothetical protein GCM10009764_77320 [Nocardia ninae]|uniref:Uncharacterized protein n=1 Tax=Nocardia ninae NBRC 108245 TaxID=1210091 RepID=A0A511MH13_9NOCA|nr:hypothetical protein NN4_44890 [Nocardia ninae NBRC 108245]